MITDRQTDILVERIVNKLNKANEYMLTQMGETVKKIGKLSPAEAQKLATILESGGDFYDIITQLTEYTGLSVNELDEIFIEYAKKDYSFYRQFYQYRNRPFIPFEENTTLLRQTTALTEEFKREMYNYIRPNLLGYSIRNAQGELEFVGLKETYNRLINEALINISQGKQTFDSAISQIIKDIGTSGLKTLDYKSGRSYRVDSMARMHLNEGLRTLHNENQKIIGEQFDYNGIEVTHHANAAPDHIDTIDGKQFALVDRIREQIVRGIEKQITMDDIRGNQVWVDGKMYDDFNAVNDSLQRPVSTLNCRHRTFSIILDVSKPRYTEEQLEVDKQKNLDGCIIDGKHYTLYEASQLQRQLERKVREQKDIQIMAKSAGNSDLVLEAQSKITQYTNKYKKVSDLSGLPTYNERMRVTGYKRTKVTNTTEIIKPVNINPPLDKYQDLITTFDGAGKLNTQDYKNILNDYDKWYSSLDKKEVAKVLDDLQEHNQKANSLNINTFSNKESNPFGEFINKKLGYDGLPKLIDEKEYFIEEDGKPVLTYRDTSALDDNHWFRGINGKDAQKHIKEFKTGKFFAGEGYDANGTFFSSSFSEAIHYADNKEENILYIIPDKNAKIIDIDKLYGLGYKINEQIDYNKYMNEDGELYINFTNQILNDNGYLASLLGYDIIDFRMYDSRKLILNRKSIKVVK